MPAIPVDSANPAFVKLKNFSLIVPIPNQTEELYTTWVLEQGSSLQAPNNVSPVPFMLLRYSKDARYFSIDPASGKDNPASAHALFMPSPAIGASDAATISNYVNRTFVITSAEDNTKFFLAETTGASDFAHCGESTIPQACTDAWSDANPLNLATPPTAYPATPVQTAEGKHNSNELVAIRLSPIAATSLAGFYPSTMTQTITATAPPVSSFNAAPNFFAFPTQHTSYFESTAPDGGAAYTYGSSASNQVNLIQKFEKKLYPKDNLVAAPIEISSIYLERKSNCVMKTMPETPCSRLMMKTYKSSQPLMLLDEVSNGGFILITRQLGKSELNFRIYNQPLSTVVSNQ